MRIILIIGLLLITVDTFACSCKRVGIIKNKKQNTYVFKGQVKHVHEISSIDTISGTQETIEFRRVQYTFEIIKNYKGQKNKETIVLTSGMTDCGVGFDKGKTYIVYAYHDDTKLHYRLTDQKTEPYITTHLCTRTKKTTIFTFWESFILWVT